ncbi:MAG: vitamin K epoxide reductase family protein [Phycisphaeraceae bacterium]
MDPIEPHPEPSHSVMLWLLRALALGALAGCGLLLVESLAQGPALPGCSPTSGCGAVLGSRWAYWLGVPVAAPAMGVYALMLAMSWQVGPGRPVAQRRLAAAVLAAAALAAAGAAAWFVLLQVAKIGAVCVYCTSTHALGLAAAAVAGVMLWRMRGEVMNRERLGESAMVAMLGLVALVGGQVMTAPPGVDMPRGWGMTGDSGPGPDREVAIAAGEHGIRLTPHDQPVLGSPDADHLLVYLYDYTCHHCRTMHRQLDTVRTEMGDRLGIVMLPVPLDADCHPLYDDTPPAHRDACELAKLALAVWRADATQYEAFDHWMVNTEQTRTLADARANAAQLVGEAALQAALADPWVQQQPERNTALHALSGAAPLPQLVGPHLWMRGRPENAAALRRELAVYLPLDPPQP